MKYIAHRINTSDELKAVPPIYGVEVDIRDQGGRLICQHEPFAEGEDFEVYLRSYHHSTLILNIKSERIEARVLELMKQHKIRDYFLLDSSFPMIYSLIRQGEANMAVRFSEFEGLETVLALAGKVRWVWVDCFTQWPLNRENSLKLRREGFQLCLVSPELQGRDTDIERYKEFLEKEQVVYDAVCTKLLNIERWKK